jgi:hypothetical protein
MAKGNHQKSANGSASEFDARLGAVADKMRGDMDALKYKYGVASSPREFGE